MNETLSIKIALAGYQAGKVPMGRSIAASGFLLVQGFLFYYD